MTEKKKLVKDCQIFSFTEVRVRINITKRQKAIGVILHATYSTRPVVHTILLEKQSQETIIVIFLTSFLAT